MGTKLFECDKCKKKCEEIWSFNGEYYPYKMFEKECKLELCKDCFDILDKKLDKKIERIRNENV